MFDIGGWELLVLAALALIIVGPKDLPSLVRNVGRWVAKARGLAREFQQGMEEAAKEADLDDVRKAATFKTGLKEEISKFGSDMKSSIESDAEKPLAGDPRNVPQPPRPPAPEAVQTQEPPRSVRHPDLDDDLEEVEYTTRPGPSAQPAAADPALRDTNDDDDAFLERFQREVGYARREGS